MIVIVPVIPLIGIVTEVEDVGVVTVSVMSPSAALAIDVFGPTDKPTKLSDATMATVAQIATSRT